MNPDRSRKLADADDMRKLKEAVAPYSEYREMLEQVSVLDGDQANELNSSEKSLGKHNKRNQYR